ncbi:hypothetical protein SK128_018278 [Halocaridina rubra]|uniref:Ubiquitin-like domain-containing protein n=1 Tax=Halocaridina rubra TaxID=373956 RepID=A0AAN8XPX5_HALRR
MQVMVKMLNGGQCAIEVSGDTKVSELKTQVEMSLFVPPYLQRLVYKGRTLAEEMSLDEAGITEGAKIHLMVKKGESPFHANGACSSKSVSSPPAVDFFTQLAVFLSKHLTEEQTTKVVIEFRKNCQLMIESMNFDDIERFAASNFTEF